MLSYSFFIVRWLFSSVLVPREFISKVCANSSVSSHKFASVSSENGKSLALYSSSILVLMLQ